MSRYLILVLFNAPLILVAIMGSVVDYKTRKYSKNKFIAQIAFWLIVFIALLSAKPIYDFLFTNSLTQTEPLSLFDVIEISGIIFSLFLIGRSRTKIETLERRVQDLHQEISIKLSNDD